ncbi:MAG: spore germination protein [Thermacetogeniaceae bacterium]
MQRKMRKPLKPSELKMRRINALLQELHPKEILEQPLSSDLDYNIKLMKELFGNSSDFVIREFHFGSDKEIRIALFYIDGLVDKNALSEAVLKPLLYRTIVDEERKLLPGDAFELIRDWLITFTSTKEVEKYGDVLDLVLAGFAALFVDGSDRALAPEVKGWKDRSIEEPKTESFVRGPRDGFTETLRTNTALIRRRIRTPRLRFEMYQVGRVTKTDVCVAYIDGLVNPATVDEVKRRITSIDTDSILESGYLEDFIKDRAWTPFTLLDRTERPDKVAAALVEGRVAILVDNTPFALIVPAVFSEFLQSAEDYYDWSESARTLRWLAIFITLTLPSFYVALTTFHQEMIPAGLALSMAAGREGVPFPAVIEALIMEITFDLLREAGTRMPRSIGQTLGVVGAIVLGQAAVMAGIVSPFIVIVVALTAVTSFLIPNYSASLTIRLLRYPMLILAGFMGLVGVFLGLLAILLHMASLRSFGVPYLYPLAPAVPAEWQDVFYRAPWWKMDLRPLLLRSPNRRRQAEGQRPEPPPVRPGKAVEALIEGGDEGMSSSGDQAGSGEEQKGSS